MHQNSAFFSAAPARARPGVRTAALHRVQAVGLSRLAPGREADSCPEGFQGFTEAAVPQCARRRLILLSHICVDRMRCGQCGPWKAPS